MATSTQSEKLMPGVDAKLAQTYEALPLPPSSRVTAETFFKYCQESEEQYPERAVVYIYRMSPMVDRTRTESPKNIWVGSPALRSDDGQVRGYLSRDWMLKEFGGGGYKLMVCDPLRPGRGHKTLAYAYFNEDDWDQFPPIINLRELVQSEKKNRRYIDWLVSRGITLPEDDMSNSETVKELADLVRDVKDNGSTTAAAIVDAVKTGIQIAGNSNTSPSLKDMLDIVERLKPSAVAAPDTGAQLLGVILPLMQSQIKAAEDRAAAAASVHAKQFELLMNLARRPDSNPGPAPDEVTQTIMQRAVAKVLENLDNPAPAADWSQYIPVVAEAAKSIGNTIATAISGRSVQTETRPQIREETGMQTQTQQVSPYVAAIVDSLVHHLEHSDGASFASSFLSFHGRMKFGFVRNLSGDDLYQHMWTHPAVRAFGAERVKQFIAEFLAWDESESE